MTFTSTTTLYVYMAIQVKSTQFRSTEKSIILHWWYRYISLTHDIKKRKNLYYINNSAFPYTHDTFLILISSLCHINIYICALFYVSYLNIYWSTLHVVMYLCVATIKTRRGMCCKKGIVKTRFVSFLQNRFSLK